MKTQPHSTGRWTVRNDGFDCEIVEQETGLVVAMFSGATPEALSLIQAAPDLLAALEAVETDCMDRGDCLLWTKLGAQIRTAIARAKEVTP